MADYHFVTRWRIPAAPERVWEVLNETDRYQEWWPFFVEYRPINPEVCGLGAAAERVVKGLLPYRLRYTTTTLHDPPREVAYDARGDLRGHGRFLLESIPEATLVTFHWDVSTTGRLMNWLAPMLQPLFAWNHNWLMAQGERGLIRRLTIG